MQTLVDKFKSFCSAVDQPAAETPKPEQPKAIRLFNIYKRSLPVGMNKLVFQNVPEATLDVLFRSLLRTKQKDDVVVYWDVVEVGSTDAWNVYSNEGIGLTEGTNINSYRPGKVNEVEWKD